MIEAHTGWVPEPPKACGYRCIPVLQTLWGKELNDAAYSYIHGLRPSNIRICREVCKLDAYTWRVTIWLEEGTDLIERIEQEIQIALFGKDAEFEPGEYVGITIANPAALAKVNLG